MPQTFQVLRCFQCLVFQVHPTKKANKWECKMCGVKQSIKRFYGLGTGKECRLHVQKLNGIQGEFHNAKLNSEDSDDLPETPDSPDIVPPAIVKKSKWLDYVDIEEQNSPDNDSQHNETEVVLELPKKRTRKSQHVNNTTSSFLNENRNKNLPSTKSFKTCMKDDSVKSVQCDQTPKIVCQTQLIDPHTKTEIPKKCVLTPTVSNSKWAQFVEDNDNSNDEHPVAISQSDLQNEPHTMFSLFDHDNIDAILDF